MADTYTVKDVTQDLGFLMTLTKVFTLDDKGFVYDPIKEERLNYRLDSNDVERQIAVFQDPLPKGDVYIFNPYAEHFGKKSPAVQLYYKTIRLALNLDVRGVMTNVLASLLDVKDAAKAGEEHSLSHVMVRMSSVPIDRKSTLYDIVDEKMVEEFEKIFDRVDDELIHVAYLNKPMTAKITIAALTDPQWDEKIGKDVRKRSLIAFKAVLMGVLDVSKPEDLDKFSVKYDPEMKTAAKFYTIMSVYLKLYSKFNDVLTEKDMIDMDQLSSVIDRMPLAYSIAKHMVQASLPRVGVTDTTPANTSALSITAGNTGTRRFAGPPIVDSFGRQVKSAPALQLGLRNEPPKRFAPHIVSDKPADPFAPATRPMNSGFSSIGQNNGGYFNQPSGFNMNPGGLNLNPPSNFGFPGTNRSNYFQ